MANKVRVWDLPVRIFHWLLVACVICSVITAYRDALDWHARFGYAILALLLFRIIWGFVGGYWSRFPSFVFAPGSVLAYLRGRPAHPDHLVGHSPVGAGSVFAMLLVLLAQVATGLVSDDDSAFTGPLNRFVATAKGLAATWYHKKIGQWLLIGLVVLHIAAVVYYLVRKKTNLISPMLGGDKLVEHETRSSRDDMATRIAALAIAALCAGFVAWLVGLGSPG